MNKKMNLLQQLKSYEWRAEQARQSWNHCCNWGRGNSESAINYYNDWQACSKKVKMLKKKLSRVSVASEGNAS